MRDLLFAFFMPVICFFALRYPFIAAGLWFWTSMFQPNEWMYGFMGGVRYNLIFALITMASVVINRDKISGYRLNGLAILIILFFIHATISSMFSISSSPATVWQRWENLLKIMIFFMLLPLTINKKSSVDFLLMCFVIAIGLFGLKEGAKFVLSGGSHTFGGLSSALPDNNFSALGLNMVLPFCLYLANQFKEHKYVRWAFLGTMALCIFAVLASNSRGGFIGLMVFLGYQFWMSKKKSYYIIAILIITPVALSLVSDKWTARMETIKTADQDSSFLGRVIAWKVNTALAMDNPFFGVGFDASFSPGVWYTQAFEVDKMGIIETPPLHTFPPKASHSIYFQVLGNQGFLGLFIYLAILASLYRSYGRFRKIKGSEEWKVDLAKSFQLSIAVFCVSGAALASAYFEFIFFAAGVILALQKQSFHTSGAK